MKKIAVFSIDDSLFGIETSYVHDFLSPKAMKNIPQKTSQFFNKVMQLDDSRFVHVVNTEKLFGLKSKALGDASRLIILHTPELGVGLLVDTVFRLSDVEDGEIMEHLPLSQIPREFISGIFTDCGEVVILLNMDAILKTLKAQS